MKISKKWLKNYVNFDLTAHELAERLTMVGLEVESLEDFGAKYDGFVVGQVIECNKHPRAARLTVCKVIVGREQLEIVCGASNVAVGQKVPVGHVGATIPHDQHDEDGEPVVLKKARIRGVESNGMICSEYELGLGPDREGIMILGDDARVGMPLAEYLGLDNATLEVSITPNRPDCLSHIGVAREVGAIVKETVKRPSISLKESNDRSSSNVAVEILDTENCPRYTARVIRYVRICPSPGWIQNALKSVGLRPINNVVDITNYVLMETGHPLHAFDYDKLAGHRIVVRRAMEGELFITLDEKKRTLRDDTLLICDSDRGVAIAGIMGGLFTEITENTTNVLLESAYFNPRSIRRTSKYLGLSTDSSYRFERGADVNGTIYALNRASQLIAEVGDGEVLGGIVDIYPNHIAEREINLRVSRVNSILGTELTRDEIGLALGHLEIEVLKKGQDNLVLRIPTFRPDLEREIDLIEEVARVHGYDNIAEKMKTTISLSASSPPRDLRQELRQWFVGSGYTEVITNSMLERQIAERFERAPVEVINPISRDMTCLRTSLVPGILRVVAHNLDHGVKNLKIFEFGDVFALNQDTTKNKLVGEILEEERLILGLTGAAIPPSWDFGERRFDIFDLKGEVETLFSKISLDNHKFICYDNDKALSERRLGIEINGSYGGYLEQLSAEMRREYDIESEVFICELKYGLLEAFTSNKRRFEELPRFPSVHRDLAFVVNSQTRIGAMQEEIRRSGGSLLREVTLFDIYGGDQLDSRKKSVAFSLEFISRDRTLTEKEVDEVVKRIIDELRRKQSAVLRG